MTQIMITKFDPAGRPAASYPGTVLVRTPDRLVARCAWRLERHDLGGLVLEPGDVLIEHYYSCEWFNVFEVRSPDDVLKGWYCNITGPVELLDAEVRWHDLALDVLVLLNGECHVLDRSEFDALDLCPSLRAQALAAVATLRTWLRLRHAPFALRIHPRPSERDPSR